MKCQLVKAKERQAGAQEQYIDADLASNSSWNTMLVNYYNINVNTHDGDVLVLTTSNSTPEIKKLCKGHKINVCITSIT